MTLYEFSLEQEVLTEKGAGVYADLFHYGQDKKRLPKTDAFLHALSLLVWDAKREVLMAKTREELARMEGKFDLVRDLLREMEGEKDADN